MAPRKILPRAVRLAPVASLIAFAACADQGRELVPIVQAGAASSSTFEYCQILYGPRPQAEPICLERVQQCRELLPKVVVALQSVQAPRRVRDKCIETASDELAERRRSDPDFSLHYRSIATGPLRNYDGEAMCLSRRLGRSDIPSVRTTPEPEACAAAPTAMPSEEEIGGAMACIDGDVTPNCRGEDEAHRAVSGFDGRVSLSLRRRCSALARVDLNGNRRPFRWSLYTSCLGRALA